MSRKGSRGQLSIALGVHGYQLLAEARAAQRRIHERDSFESEWINAAKIARQAILRHCVELIEFEASLPPLEGTQRP